MDKKLGKTINPDQYSIIPKNISPVDNSIKAREYFIEHGCPEDIIVVPIVINLSSIKVPVAYYWAALSNNGDEYLYVVPCFNIGRILSASSTVTSIKMITEDSFFIWNGVFYTFLFTSTEECVIRKVNGVWSEEDVVSFMKIKAPHLIRPNIYPVEIFSSSLKKFLCAAWAIEDVEADVELLYPIHWDDYKLLDQYDCKDFEVFPLDIGDITKAGNIVFKVNYTSDLGVYLEKTKDSLDWRHLLNQDRVLGCTITLSSSSKVSTKNQKKKKQKTIKLTLNSKKE